MPVIALVAGVVELVLSLIFGVLVAFASFKVFARITRDFDEIQALKGNNAAAGVLIASMLLSCALIVRHALYPSISSLQTALFKGPSLIDLAKVVGLTIVFFVVALVVAIAAVGLGTRIFMRLTRELDEMAEIRNSNIAVSLALGAVIIVMGLFLSQGVESLLSALIPYPALETIQVMGKP